MQSELLLLVDACGDVSEDCLMLRYIWGARHTRKENISRYVPWNTRCTDRVHVPCFASSETRHFALAQECFNLHALSYCDCSEKH